MLPSSKTVDITAKYTRTTFTSLQNNPIQSNQIASRIPHQYFLRYTIMVWDGAPDWSYSYFILFHFSVACSKTQNIYYQRGIIHLWFGLVELTYFKHILERRRGVLGLSVIFKNDWIFGYIVNCWIIGCTAASPWLLFIPKHTKASCERLAVIANAQIIAPIIALNPKLHIQGQGSLFIRKIEFFINADITGWNFL